MSHPGKAIPLIERAERWRQRTAIRDATGVFTYGDLLEASFAIAGTLLGGRLDLAEQPVAFLVTPGFSWAAVQWGIWRAGGIAVPLPNGATGPELDYLAEDSQASTLIYDEAAGQPLTPAARKLRCCSVREALAGRGRDLPKVDVERRAMILYTSGTTSRPKGVVTAHANIAAQITTLVTAWEWSRDDRILLCLPLHHVHGIINVLSCALWSGAWCRMLPRFAVEAVSDSIAHDELTLFMAVPTIYAKLVAAWDAAHPDVRQRWIRAFERVRLMVSGSAALPVSTLEQWKRISGHTLLERYGMTEIGMALSNPLHGQRRPGSVGKPLPGVEVRLAGDGGEPVEDGAAGEIEVRGPSVFREYWRNPEATREAFRNGWFRTGDTALVEDGHYRILGRTTVDILKTGGHKVSALEIEEVLRRHPAIAECAVVGVPDAEWGERVCAAVVVRDGAPLQLKSLREWARDFLTAHKLPSRLLVVAALPRNAMGKVVKPQISALFAASSGDSGTQPAGPLPR